jgi:hypothetical protein
MLDGLSVFFPCCNEEQNVLSVVGSALQILPRVAEDFEIIVVDDGSRDRRPDQCGNSLPGPTRRLPTTWIPVTHHPRRAGVPTGAKPAVVMKAIAEFGMLFLDLLKSGSKAKNNP